MLFRYRIMAFALSMAFFQNNLAAGDITKINNDLYVGHKDDLSFVFERVTSDSIDFWNAYIKNQTKGIHDILPPEFTSPFDSFAKTLSYYKADDVWIAYATQHPITKKAFETPLKLTGDIEMAVPIMTNYTTPFYTPMGIIRAVEFTDFKNPNNLLSRSNKPLKPFTATYKPHKNLSPTLHSFAAQAIKKIYGNKEYVITRPVKTMADIFQKNLPTEAVWIGSMKEMNEVKMRFQKIIDQETTTLNMISDYENHNISAHEFMSFVEKNKQRLLHKFSSEEKKAWEQAQQNNHTQQDKALRLKIDDMVAKMKRLQTELRDNDQKTWHKELSIDETTSPVQDINFKQKTITLLNRSGKKVSFPLPTFMRHPHLEKGSLDPMVIVDIDALAGLLKLD